ncbi:MAG: MMPL family transporter [Proteobacteria bacterium]|nr:MMPL family transporter [Pseudomonadota bacterium]
MSNKERITFEKRMLIWVDLLARFVVQKKFYIALINIAITIFFLYQASNVPLRTYFRDLLPSNHAFITLVKKYSSFGGTNQILIEVRAKNGTIFNEKSLKKIIKISDELLLLPGVDRNKIISIGVNKIKNFKVSSWGLEFPSLMYPGPPATEEEMEDLKRNIYSNTLYFGKLVSLDSKAAIITAGFFEEGVDCDIIYDKIQQIKKKYEDENDEIFVVGEPYLYGVISHYIGQTLKVFIITGIAIFIVALLYTSSLRLVLLTFFPALICAIWGIGFIGLWDYNLDPLILVVPLLLCTRALSHSMQFNWRINEEYADTGDIPTAVANTIRGLFYPGVSGIITDSLSILLIAFVPIPIMQKLGLICFCWAMNMIVVCLIQNPVIYLYLPFSAEKNRKWRDKKRSGWLDNFMGKVAACSKGNGARIIIVATVIIIIIAGWYTKNVEVGDVYPGTPLLRANSPYNKACGVFARDFPGSMDPLIIVATGDNQKGLADRKLMEKISEFQFYLMQNPLIEGTSSVADLLKNMQMKYQENDPKQYVLPDSDAGVAAVLFLLMGGGAEPGDFDQYYSEQLAAASLVAYCKDHTARTINNVLKYCRDFIDCNKEKGIQFNLAAGIIGVVAATNDSVARDQILLSIAAFALTYLCVAFFFQSFVPAGILMVPLLVSNLAVYGYMGMSGLSLNLQTLAVPPIAVGIGVDYGIYLFSRVREETQRLQSFEMGITEAVRTAGNAITITALLIIVGVIFWAISDIKFQADMGLLLAVVTCFHLLCTLFLLPVIIRIIKPKSIMNCLASGNACENVIMK